MRLSLCQGMLFAMCGAIATVGNSCVSTPGRRLVFEQQVTLPSGRFIGPIDVKVPSPEQHLGRALVFETTVTAACTPRFLVGHADGSNQSVGAPQDWWQGLLTTRATYEPQQASTQQSTALPIAEQPVALAQQQPSAVAAPSMQPQWQQPTQPLQPTGHWQTTQVETWPGQILFETQRAQKCAEIKTWRSEHTSYVDGTGVLSLWSTVPQELASATMRVRVYELIDEHDEAQREASLRREQEAKENAIRVATQPGPVVTDTAPQPATVAAHVEVKVKVQTPMPPPKKEKTVAEDPTAKWNPGHWEWQQGQGEWVWIRGWWNAPKNCPPLRRGGGNPPVAGAGWAEGHWQWMPGQGRWLWRNGHWTQPPPKIENPGQPPIAGQPWIAGHWESVGISFEWQSGYWGQPPPKVENPGAPQIPGQPWVAGHWVQSGKSWEWVNGHWGAPPAKIENPGSPPLEGQKWIAGYWVKPSPKPEVPGPKPTPGAVWIAGLWIPRGDSWVWSAGSYNTGRRPPPPKAETPSASPMPGAVWLAGFWMLSNGEFAWTPGRWELPPGVGYAWVWDPMPAQQGQMQGPRTGHWVLGVDINLNVNVNPGGRR
jgi:hypothetical protein